MKHGWEYKKFTDVVWFQEGPGVRNTQYREKGIKLLNVSNLVDGKLLLSNSSRYISEDEAYGKYSHFLVDEGDFIIASSGIQVSYFDKKMGFAKAEHLPLCMNTSTIRFKVLDKNELEILYFMYYMKSDVFKSMLSRQITGSAQLNFGPSHLKKMSIPLPPLSIQQSIVAELDKINELIRIKKEQLSDYDKLAQSVFYEMFGDPIENEKGWDVKKLGEFGKVVTGNTPSRKESKYYSEYHIEWIKTDNIVSGKMYATTASEYLSQLGASVGRKVKAGSVLVACIAGSLSSLGRCCIVDREVAFNQQINAIELYSDKANSKYCYWLITLSSKYIQEFATTGMKHIISKTIFEDIALILPPIEIQQNFAQRIELIEKQKAEIKSTIANLETLLASRMQYWFE